MFSLPPPFGHTSSLMPVAGHDVHVDHGGRVVAGVLPVEERVVGDGLAEVALAVSAATPH